MHLHSRICIHTSTVSHNFFRDFRQSKNCCPESCPKIWLIQRNKQYIFREGQICKLEVSKLAVKSKR